VFVALVIQHSERMRHVYSVICYLSVCLYHVFLIYLTKETIKKMEYMFKMCVLIFSVLLFFPKTFLILRRIQRDIIINV
jgi:hypothetical protein